MKDLLIIGAGPYGLATAATAKTKGLSFEIVGTPMGLWREHMPKGMILRTSKDEHFDTQGIHTMDAFMAERGITEAEMRPLPLSRYLDYSDWFIQKKDLKIINDQVDKLDFQEKSFRACLKGGRILEASKVIVAIGVKDFKNIPVDLERRVPKGRYCHSSDLSDLGIFESKKVLIIGGRQSAFETAALLCEEGASSVYVACRHKAPQFTHCDFSFMQEIISNVVADPSWYRNLPKEEVEKWSQLAFQEGRLKLEHWLEPRLKKGNVQILENTSINTVVETQDHALKAEFTSGTEIICDHVIFATGFKPDISKIRFFRKGNILGDLAIKEGSPRLDISFQSSQKGLYFLGMLSIPDFGFSFGFSTGAPAAAALVTSAILNDT